MGSSRSSILCFLMLCASFLVPTSCHSYSHGALFIFGDSFYDAGNNIYLNTSNTSLAKLNIFPYGETYFKHPTGRVSDAEFAKLPLIPPYLQPGNHQFTNGVNFASGGAGALVENNQGPIMGLKTQLRNFKNMEKQLRKKLGASEIKTLLSTAVYMFSIGSNDYLVPFITNSTLLQSYSKKEYVKMVIGNITTVIQEIYKIGGRKFGLSKLIPLGCFPFSRAQKLSSTALLEALKELKKSQLKGYTYSIFDAYTAATAIFNNPSKYGFEEVKMACCGSGPLRGSLLACGLKVYQLCDNVSQYFFFDELHPTEKANYQFAKLMWDGSPKIVKPYNLKTLFKK
ncbi:hypothetical protein POPTR_017G134350v4 [Populus trichocarpa]|uniref:Gibberellin-regulated family protein n=1 Tax=Populus trichocarpa TaxID=3694 RepID=A0A2K1X706_POPTR|nr:hypothetical protein POPTR_017G134350v4 [Populus trichocarpa]